MGKIQIDVEKCLLCGDCALACSSAVLVAREGKIEVAAEEHCNLCGHCLALCPVEAITIAEMDAREFLDLPGDLRISPEALATFLRSRRSCRHFSDREVPRQILEKLIDMARYAPTGHNSQNFEFLVIQGKKILRELAQRTAVFFGNLYHLLKAQEETLPPWLKGHMRGFRMNWEYSQAGKDRIFRQAPALIIIHAPAENTSSAQNCHLAMAHLMLQAQAMGLGTCIIGYFLNAAERDPSLVKDLEIPKEHKIFTCCTVGYPVLKFRKVVQRKPPAVRWL